MTATTISTIDPTQGYGGPDPRVGLPHDVTVGRLTPGHVLHAEWIKLRSLRSTWLTLAAAVASLAVVGAVTAYTLRTAAEVDPFDATLSASLQGYLLAELLVGVLGVLFVAGEYGTGMIRATFTAVPRRSPVLIAKAVVLGAVTLTTMTAASFATFLSVQLAVGEDRRYSLGEPTTLRVVLGTALFLSLVALLGSALGWLLRNTAAAISTLTVLLLIVPVLAQTLLGGFGRTIAPYLPTSAGSSFIDSVPVDNALSPAAGLAVLTAWVVAALLAAGIVLRRRDA